MPFVVEGDDVSFPQLGFTIGVCYRVIRWPLPP